MDEKSIKGEKKATSVANSDIDSARYFAHKLKIISHSEYCGCAPGKFY